MGSLCIKQAEYEDDERNLDERAVLHNGERLVNTGDNSSEQIILLLR